MQDKEITKGCKHHPDINIVCMDCVKEKEIVEEIMAEVIDMIPFLASVKNSHDRMLLAISESLQKGKELGKQDALLELGKPTQEQLKAVAEKARKQFAEEINPFVMEILDRVFPVSVRLVKLNCWKKLQKEVKE